MRIISQFKDYYDNMIVHGSDPNIVYMRKTEVIEDVNDLKFKILDKGILKNKNNYSIHIPCHLIIKRNPRKYLQSYNVIFDKFLPTYSLWFCGKIYHFFEFDGVMFYDLSKLSSYITSDEFQREITDINFPELKHIDKDLIEENFNQKNIGFYSELGSSVLGYDSWEFAKNNRYIKDQNQIDKVFIEINSPYFVDKDVPMYTRARRSNILIINPNLKQYNFEKIIDPMTAYQEISMFVGNQLAKQKDPDPINTGGDKILASEKGFDQWSFRTKKEDSKKNKRKIK